jgi:hypothetical protein
MMMMIILTPWNKVLLEKLTGSQLVKKFPAFYGPRTFIAAFAGARYLSISCAMIIIILLIIKLIYWSALRQLKVEEANM